MPSYIFNKRQLSKVQLLQEFKQTYSPEQPGKLIRFYELNIDSLLTIKQWDNEAEALNGAEMFARTVIALAGREQYYKAVALAEHEASIRGRFANSIIASKWYPHYLAAIAKGYHYTRRPADARPLVEDLGVEKLLQEGHDWAGAYSQVENSRMSKENIIALVIIAVVTVLAILGLTFLKN